MSVVEGRPRGARPRLQPARGRPAAWWGIVLLSTTEGMLFGLLLFVYFYLWSIAPEWPPGEVEPPELLISGIRSLLLFASSATMVWAERAIRRGNRGQASAGLGATIFLAVVFLAGHVQETIKIAKEEFLPYDHAYGSIFTLVTNFHAAHLTVGVIILGFLLLRMGRGAYGPDDDRQMKIGGFYWHFVDAIWAVVYTSLYIAPNLFAGKG